MIELLEYTSVTGKKTNPEITIFALSTCGFCKRSLAFLEANEFAYRYVHIDKISLDAKSQVKRELKEKYKVDIAFPFATLSPDSYLVGFIEVDWRKTLGL